MELDINSYKTHTNKIENIFKMKLYTNNDWKKVLSILKSKTKDELIDIIDNILKESYKGIIPYPRNACNFASDFSYMIFRDLGYEVRVQRFNHPKIGEHNFILLDNEIIDFTNKQFDTTLRIRVESKSLLQYKEAIDNKFRNDNLKNLTFGWFTQKAREKDFIGLLNYVPFSYIINKLLYQKEI